MYNNTERQINCQILSSTVRISWREASLCRLRTLCNSSMAARPRLSIRANGRFRLSIGEATLQVLGKEPVQVSSSLLFCWTLETSNALRCSITRRRRSLTWPLHQADSTSAQSEALLNKSNAEITKGRADHNLNRESILGRHQGVLLQAIQEKRWQDHVCKVLQPRSYLLCVALRQQGSFFPH